MNQMIVIIISLFQFNSIEFFDLIFLFGSESKKSKKSCIRVGAEFQADLDIIRKSHPRTNLEKTSEIPVWKPCSTLSDNDRIDLIF